MSLTSLIRNKSPVRERLADWFPKPKLPLSADLKVPSLAKNRSLVGTAYDYLLRFSLEREMPFSTSYQWSAEKALESIRTKESCSGIQVGDNFRPTYEVRADVELMILDADYELSRFIKSGSISTRLIESALNLAHCDVLYRIGRLDARFGQPPLREEILELHRLLRVTDIKSMVGKETCLLNPHFGLGSDRLGGADADLLVDDLLIDIKTVSNLSFRVEDWRQLIGYAALSEHFPIGGRKGSHKIRRIGIYFARHSYLASWPLRHVVDPKRFSEFALWLANFATTRQAQKLVRQAERLRRQSLRLINENQRRLEENRTRPKRLMSKPKTHRPSQKIERERTKFRPNYIKWLFVAEAPPGDIDRFFYYENVAQQDGLFIATMRSLYREISRLPATKIRSLKAQLLKKFAAEGCYLIDVCNQPINRSSTKRAQVRAAIPSLEHNLDKLRADGCLTGDTKIILVSCTVHDICFDMLFDAGFNVINSKPLEFPASGHQKTYTRKLTKLLKANGRVNPQNQMFIL